MQHTMRAGAHGGRRSNHRLWRGLVAAAALVLAGGLLQTVHAAHYTMHGGPGLPALSDMDGLVMAHPRQLGRLFDAVGATAEQRAQIEQIAQAARADLRAQREAGQALREQGRALFAQPTVDAAAAEALRRQWLARHDQASQRMLQALLEMSRVLTPEQRQSMSALMAERRARMDRQRAERAAATATPR